MNYKKILLDYDMLVDKLIDIHNLTSAQKVINDKGVPKITPIYGLVRDKNTTFAIAEKKNNIQLMVFYGYGGYPRSYVINRNCLTSETFLNARIESAKKPVMAQFNRLEKQLKGVQNQMQECVNLIADFKTPIIEHLNQKGLPCESLIVKQDAIVYITIDGKERPIYEIRTFVPIKLRQYKGRGYSMIPHIYKKTLRHYMREHNQLKEFIF